MQPDILLNSRYRVIYAIDERPNSQLLRARDEQNGSLVLLAVLPLVAGQRESTEQIVKQIAGVQHDLLVPLTDHFIDGERLLLVAPDPGGQDVERSLRSRGGALPEQETLASATKLMQLFDLLHSQKPPLHIGDIWPSDIVVTPESWRMLPFTLARLVDPSPSPYRAPELAQADVEPANETDTYALSALVYYALTGIAPATPQQQEAGLPLAAPRSLNPTISALAEQVLLRALQQKPANRYQNARELRLALETVHLMAGRSLGLGPDILRSSEVLADTARSGLAGQPALPSPTAPQPLLQDVPLPVAPAVVTPISNQASYQPLPTTRRRGLSTGCLIALALGLAAIVVALAVALVFAIAINGGFANLFGRNPLPSSQSAAVSLSPQAITLGNVATITNTAEITSDLFGAVTYSPNGDSLAIGLGNSVRIMDTNLHEQRALNNHHGRVFGLSYSPDGKLLASVAFDDPDVRVWNPQTGELLYTLRGHSQSVRSAVISPNGKLIASGAADLTIRLWNSADGTPIKTLQGHTDWVSNLVFSPDGSLLASSSHDGTVRLWNMPAGTPRAGFSYTAQLNAETNKPSWTTGLAFTSNGARLAIGSFDGTITIVSSTDGKIERRIAAQGGYIALRGLFWSKDDRTLYSAASNGVVKAWDAASGGEIGEFTGNSLSVFAITLRPDGSQLASVSDDEGKILVWNTATRAKVSEATIGRGRTTRLAYVPDGQVLGITSYNGMLSMRNADGHEALVSPAGSAFASVFLRDARLGIVTDQNEVRLVGGSTNANTPLEGLEGTPSALTANRKGTILAAGSTSGSVVIWNDQGAKQQQFRSALAGVGELALNDSGEYIAVGGTPNLPQIEIHNARSGELQQTLAGPRGGVVLLAFRPDSDQLAAIDSTGELFVWDAPSGKLLELFTGNSNQLGFTALTYTPDGSLLIGGTANGQLVAWNTTNLSQVAEITVSADAPILSLAVSPNGQQLAASVHNLNLSLYTLEIAKQ